MTESEFNHLVDQTLEQIEDALDRSNVDFDYQNADGLFTFEYENGVKLILSRQTPVTQLWLATPKGALHFEYDAGRKKWLDDKTKAELFEVLSAHSSEQSGENIQLTSH